MDERSLHSRPQVFTQGSWIHLQEGSASALPFLFPVPTSGDDAMRNLFVGAGLALLALQPAGTALSPVKLHDDAPMYDAVDGQRGGILLSGTPVRVLETRPGWFKISVEGWIRDEGSVLGATPPAVAAVSSRARLSGQIFVTGEDGATHVGQHVTVRLLRDFGPSRDRIAQIRSGCDRRRQELGAEAARLKEEGGRAMRVIENPAEAFEKYDEAKRQREATLRQLESHDAQCAAEVESALNDAAVDRALSDSEGRYLFDAVEPGAYHLHASLEAAGVRTEWILELNLVPGEARDIDLTNENQTSSDPLPIYR